MTTADDQRPILTIGLSRAFRLHELATLLNVAKVLGFPEDSPVTVENIPVARLTIRCFLDMTYPLTSPPTPHHNPTTTRRKT